MFKAYIEDWESNLTLKGDEILEAKLRDKYIGMRIHDTEDGADGYDEKRLIYDIAWQASRPKGWYALTGLIKEDGNVNRTVEMRQQYIISSGLLDIITEDMNTAFNFFREVERIG